MKENEDELGKKFRESLENYEVEYDPNAWAEFQPKLSNSAWGKTKFFLTKNWYWLCASLFLLSVGIYWNKNVAQKQEISQTETQKKIENTLPSEKENKPKNKQSEIAENTKNADQSTKNDLSFEKKQKHLEISTKKEPDQQVKLQKQNKIKNRTENRTENKIAQKNEQKSVLGKVKTEEKNDLKKDISAQNALETKANLEEKQAKKDQLSDLALLNFLDLKIKDSVFRQEIDSKHGILSMQNSFEKKIQFAAGVHFANSFDQKNGFNLGAGLKFSYIFRPQWAFQTGFWFTHFEDDKKYFSKIVLPKDNHSFPQINSDSISVPVSNRDHSETTLLEIPLGVQYYLSSRISFSASISTFYMVEDGKNERLPSFLLAPSEQRIKKQDFSLGMLYFSANYQFPLSKKLNLGFNSFVKIPLKNNPNLPNSWFGLQTLFIFGK